VPAAPSKASQSRPYGAAVRFAAYLVASIMGAVLLGIAGLCATAAGRNHLSPWWIPAYVSLLTAFALIAETTVSGLALS